MKTNFIEKMGSFYFIGIGGISMSALAKYMLSLEKKVAGSDCCNSRTIAELQSMGVIIDEGTADLSGYDVIVYTDAVMENNDQLKLARSLNKPVISRGKFLGEVCRDFSSVTAVCGCHGKTTCTAMLANIYFAANKKFMAHIGGMDVNLTNFYYSGDDSIITEACEYKKNFLALKPDIAVILNTDFDHTDCYANKKELRSCYKQFALQAKKTVCLCGEGIKGLVNFGLDRHADYSADKITYNKGGVSFDICIYGKNCGKLNIRTYGRHNVLNALAATAAASAAGIEFCDIKKGFENFNGVERRMEKIGTFAGTVCLADYAHHPNEIKATIKAVRKLTKGKIYVIFQPHTYSRTRNLFDEFVKVLSDISHLMIYRTYAAREYYDDKGSALTLANAVDKACYGETAEDIMSFIDNVIEEDIILFLGAGDIYFIAKNLICREKSAD